MTPKFLSEFLLKFPLKEERAKKLIKLSHNLTICAREFQLPSTASDDKSIVIKKLLGFSELHHKLTAQIGHYLAGEAKSIYPEDVFSQILFEVAAQYEVVAYLEGAIQNAVTGTWRVE